MGCLSLGYDAIQNDGYISLEFPELIYFNDYNRLGFRWSMVELPKIYLAEESEYDNELIFTPIDIIYSPFGENKFWGAEFYLGAAVGWKDEQYNPLVRGGFRLSPFFSKPEREMLYYLPNLSAQMSTSYFPPLDAHSSSQRKPLSASIQANVDLGMLLLIIAAVQD